MSEPQEVYLGDGLYASFDGWMVMLRAPREEGDHWIGLEPQVWQALTDFVAHATQQAAIARQAL